jgi:RNA-directed DNA polymerase
MKVENFAKIIGSTEEELNGIIENISSYYVEDSIPKVDSQGHPKMKNGVPSHRKICKSVGKLKVIQKRLHKRLLSKIELPYYVVGSVKGISNIDNARYHLGQRYIFQTDLVNFFGFITNQMVFNSLNTRYGFKVASLITKLTTYKGHLPQGTPTSPILANLAGLTTDKAMLSLAQAFQLKYTRYVDDLTFSSSVNFKDLLPEIIAKIEGIGFLISDKKTTYKADTVITGVRLNRNQMSPTTIHYDKYSKGNLHTKRGYLCYFKGIENRKAKKSIIAEKKLKEAI